MIAFIKRLVRAYRAAADCRNYAAEDEARRWARLETIATGPHVVRTWERHPADEEDDVAAIANQADAEAADGKIDAVATALAEAWEEHMAVA